jgi:hypothetical protein
MPLPEGLMSKRARSIRRGGGTSDMHAGGGRFPYPRSPQGRRWPAGCFNAASIRSSRSIATSSTSSSSSAFSRSSAIARGASMAIERRIPSTRSEVDRSSAMPSERIRTYVRLGSLAPRPPGVWRTDPRTVVDASPRVTRPAPSADNGRTAIDASGSGYDRGSHMVQLALPIRAPHGRHAGRRSGHVGSVSIGSGVEVPSLVEIADA